MSDDTKDKPTATMRTRSVGEQPATPTPFGPSAGQADAAPGFGNPLPPPANPGAFPTGFGAAYVPPPDAAPAAPPPTQA